MKTATAVLVETGKPLVLADLEIPPLKAGQVLVEIAVSGVCHTQILECRGWRGKDPYLPHCMGHEGGGIVREVGQGVGKVAVGDRVILSWMKGSGADVNSTVYLWDGRSVNAGGITTFSRYSVISENRLTIIPSDLSMHWVAMLGCAVPTGLGVVFHTAKAQPGQSIAIFGIGGIGLCAVAGAGIAGCTPVIAIDIRQEKLPLAKTMGATHCVDASQRDPVEAVKALCPGGVDFAIEASGQPAVMIQALSSVRRQGGAAVVVGNARHGDRLNLDPWELNLGKRLWGTWGGDNVPDRDFPQYVKLLSSGRLNLTPLLSRIYALSEVNEALSDLEAGRVVRPLIDMTIGQG